MVNPATGDITKVFDGDTWMNKDAQGDAAFNKGINLQGYTIRVTLKNGKEIAVPAGKDYPLDQMAQLRKNGINGINFKDIKNIQGYGAGELKPR